MHTITSAGQMKMVKAHDEALDTIFAGRSIETFQAGRAVFWEGDAADDVFLVTQGLLRLYRLLPDGRRVVLGFIFAGDMLGLSLQDEYLFTAEAVSHVRLVRVSKSQFYGRISQSPQFGAMLTAHPRDEMCAAQDQMMLLLRRAADERVAAFLLFVAEHTGRAVEKGSEILLCMSRTDMADYLGLTIETVSRCMSKLRANGVISLESSARVRVEKPQMLEQVASGDDDILVPMMAKPARRPVAVLQAA